MTTTTCQLPAETTSTHKPEALLRQLEAILRGTAQQTKLAPVPAAKLSDALDGVEQLASMLTDLQALVVLDDVEDAGHGMDAARRQWESVACDRVVTRVGDLVATSPTFTTLHQAAVTVRSVTRFGPERLRVATILGQHLAAHPRYVGQLAVPSTRPDGSPDLTFPVSHDASESLGRALAALTQAGIIDHFCLKGRVTRPDGSRIWRDWPHARREGATQWRVWRGNMAAGWAEFLSGDWLTAYAYAIARDQFERAGEPFEIYSKVCYTLPADLGGGTSDVDVLVRTADLLLCIECKTGWVLKDFGNGTATAAAKTIAGAERLDAILSTMGVELNRMYRLLYVNTVNESPTDVTRALAASGVPVMLTTPSDVRQLILQAVRGLPLEVRDDSATNVADGGEPTDEVIDATAPSAPTPPSAADHAYTGAELFAVEHGGLRHRWRSGPEWSSWHQMDAPSDELVHVGAAQHDLWTDLWVTDGTTIWHRWLGPDSAWSDWDVWGSGSGPITAGSGGSDHVEVFFYDTDARRRHSWFAGTQWSPWAVVEA